MRLNLNFHLHHHLRTLFNTLDDIGIIILLTPLSTIQPILQSLLLPSMSFLQNIEFLNLLDDMGIILIIRPLGYLHRFAEIILLADE
ncbi:hypothetical protein IFR04_009193 [Cadophora malorum]|uniref:Uncharacterized protein n=1 Tax=Cadophora malorum TaxID=108018 RepID=A0A8H7TA06_9HELO|nr:hypothetical protein IFR04_009193 [Cadophora malorum]